jgi:hypothetical protein
MNMSGEKDFLDEFADEDGVNVAPVIEQPAPTDMEPAGSGRQRGPDGKFIKAEAQAKAEQAEKGAQEAVQTAVTEPPSDDDETGTVPIHVLKALRKEIQALKAEKSAQPQPKAPEFNGPQVAFEQDPRSYLEQTLHAQKMQMSMFMATQQNDETTVKEAWSAFDEACRNDPAVSAYSYTLLNHPHPMGELVKWYNREQQLRMLNEAGGLEALIQQRMGQGGVPAAPQGKPNLPPSLAGTGKVRSSEVNSVDADPFDAVFKKR